MINYSCEIALFHVEIFMLAFLFPSMEHMTQPNQIQPIFTLDLVPGQVSYPG